MTQPPEHRRRPFTVVHAVVAPDVRRLLAWEAEKRGLELQDLVARVLVGAVRPGGITAVLSAE